MGASLQMWRVHRRAFWNMRENPKSTSNVAGLGAAARCRFEEKDKTPNNRCDAHFTSSITQLHHMKLIT
jgi:hypothetical protein